VSFESMMYVGMRASLVIAVEITGLYPTGGQRVIASTASSGARTRF